MSGPRTDARTPVTESPKSQIATVTRLLRQDPLRPVLTMAGVSTVELPFAVIQFYQTHHADVVAIK